MATLLGIASSGLLAYQRAISTVGHNVSNADTEGYSRQRVDFETRNPSFSGSGWQGNGVDVATVQRYYDDFIATQVRTSQSVTSKAETLSENASRLDDLLADPMVGLDPALQSFFDAMQTLSDDPASAAARQVVLSESQSLADRFAFFDRQYDELRREINQKMSQTMTDINTLAGAIADVNQKIIQANNSDGRTPPNDLLDQREILLKGLSKLVDIQVFEQDDGAYNVSIGTGQGLVIGSQNTTLGVYQNPEDSNAPGVAFVTSFSSEELTDQISGGKLGGLLEFREQFLDAGQNQLGQVAVGIVESINAQQVQGVDLLGSIGTNFFQPITFSGVMDTGNTGTATVSATFSSSDLSDVTSSDYRLTYNSGTSYTLTRLSDGVTAAVDSALPTVTDGFTLSITGASGLVAGDSFLIQPTRSAAGDVSLLISDTNKIAAAGALRANEVMDANGHPVNTGSALITQAATTSATGLLLSSSITLTYSADADGSGNSGFVITGGPAAPNNYVLYDPTSTDVSGKSFPDGTNPTQFSAYGGLTFDISGTPIAGDQFVISNNSSGTADNRNALAMGGMGRELLMAGGTSTIQGIFGQMVADIGALARQAETNYNAQKGLLTVQESSLASISGVNLDEEAANLMKYQQAYQAAAQVVAVAGVIFDTLIGAMGR
ncbi:MAG: flagellar hook-associated protein FlgK [Sedimenticola sp.]